MEKTTVLFDGACHLCSREIEHYRRLDRAARLQLIDIAAPHFDAAAHGMDPAAVHKHLHVRRIDGSWAIGVDAFIAIWETLPRYRWAARWAARAPVKAVLRLGYAGFAKVRPYLPRRLRYTCEDGACEVHGGA